MAYEYEHRNIKANVYSRLATNESVEELKEVYRKAKAFDEIVNLLKTSYLHYADDTLEDIEIIIDDYMEDE